MLEATALLHAVAPADGYIGLARPHRLGGSCFRSCPRQPLIPLDADAPSPCLTTMQPGPGRVRGHPLPRARATCPAWQRRPPCAACGHLPPVPLRVPRRARCLTIQIGEGLKLGCPHHVHLSHSFRRISVSLGLRLPSPRPPCLPQSLHLPRPDPPHLLHAAASRRGRPS